MNNRAAFLVSAGSIAAAAILGSRFAPNPAHPRTLVWYGKLDKPGFTPPGPVFGGAWAMLYPVLGWAGYRLLTAPASQKRSQAVAAWGANVTAIGIHPYLLFGLRKLGVSTTVLSAEGVASLALVAAASKVDRTVAWVQVPLVLWTIFATLLNEELWRRN